MSALEVDLANSLALALASLLLLTSGCTLATFGWAREEVAVVGVHFDNDGAADGVLVDVKNVVGTTDGYYAIVVSAPVAHGALDTTGSSSLTMKFVDNRETGFELIGRDFFDLWSDTSADNLMPTALAKSPFNLRAHVERSGGREYSVVVEADLRRDGNWVTLCTAHVGVGEQSSARIVGAYAALPVTLDVIPAVVAGLAFAYLWLTFGQHPNG